MNQFSLSERIAHFAIHTEFNDSVSAQYSEALDILALSLLDWCAVGRAGIQEPVSQVVRRVNTADAGAAQSSIFGSTQKLPARLAAQVNGATSHALDYDDTHFMHIGHTSVVIFPAALAVGEWQSASFAHMMEAALIGSEVCCHVGHWLGRSHYEAGFHQTATAGTFGATATACRLLKLDVETTLQALGLATTLASGLTSQFGTMGKPFHAGMAAANGVQAAMLAADGFTSRVDALHCAQGFAETHSVDTLKANEQVFEMGQRFVFGDVQHKYHACCHGLHASLEALAQLRTAHRIDADAVHQLSIQTNPRWLNVCNIQTPETALESKFSYRHTSALLFAGFDTAALDTYSDALCHEQTLQELRNKVNVKGNDKLSDTQTQVRIELLNGQSHELAFDLATPLPLALRREKLLGKCRSIIGSEASLALWQLIQDGQNLSVESFALSAMQD